MQISRLVLSEETAYMFAKLQMAYGGKSAQRTLDEVLTAAWYLITQDAVPPRLALRSEESTVIDTIFNFNLVGESYVQMFVEIKRRLSLGGRGKATNADVVEHVIKTMYAYHRRFQGREG